MIEMGTTYYGKTFLDLSKLITFMNATTMTGIDGCFYAHGKGLVLVYHVTT